MCSLNTHLSIDERSVQRFERRCGTFLAISWVERRPIWCFNANSVPSPHHISVHKRSSCISLFIQSASSLLESFTSHRSTSVQPVHTSSSARMVLLIMYCHRIVSPMRFVAVMRPNSLVSCIRVSRPCARRSTTWSMSMPICRGLHQHLLKPTSSQIEIHVLVMGELSGSEHLQDCSRSLLVEQPPQCHCRNSYMGKSCRGFRCLYSSEPKTRLA